MEWLETPCYIVAWHCNSLKPLLAEEGLQYVSLHAAGAGTMTKGDQRSFLDQLRRDANPNNGDMRYHAPIDKPPEISPEESLERFKAMEGGGIEVSVVNEGDNG